MEQEIILTGTQLLGAGIVTLGTGFLIGMYWSVKTIKKLSNKIVDRMEQRCQEIEAIDNVED